MALDDLKQCCLQLDSDRVTDRKKGNDQLKYLLNNASIVGFLNTKPDGFNWNQVLYSAKNFFLKEAKRVEEEERKKRDVSQTVLSNRANQKRCAAALPKLVMKKSCLKTPHVSARMVIDLVLTVLDRHRPYLLENFAGDFIQITLKYLLHFPQYYLEVPAERWKDLMKICIWVYENELPNTDAVSIIGVLEGIVRCCRVRGDQHRKFIPFLILRPLPSFLKRALTNNKLSSQYGLQSSLLSLLLTFTKTMASEWRCLLCSVGEETFLSVLAMWESRPSSRQMQWLEYINLQILIHHPQKDGKISKESNFSHDPLNWQRCLHRLYQLIHDHLDQLVKNKLSSASSLSAEQQTIPPLLVTLAARLCHKVFDETEGYGVLDLTQQGSTQISGTVGNKPYKRRKIEVGLQPLANMLREEGTQLHTIPWYQILHELLKYYSLFFHQARCSQMLQLFTHVLSECRRPAVQEYILWCLGALAHQYNRVYPPNETKSELRTGKWTPIWDLTLRLVNGKQCSKSGMELLQTLMNTGLAYPSPAIFNLFHQGHTDMNETALSTLLVSLSLISLPKHFKNESAVLSEDQVKNARINLVHALLPLHNGGCAVIGSLTSVASLESPLLLAQLLLVLRHRDPRCAQGEMEGLTEYKRKRVNHHDNLDFLTQLEDMYLLSTFCCDIPKSQHLKSDATGLKRNAKEWKILQKEEEYMIQRVITFVEQVMSEDILTTPNGIQVLLQVLQLIIILLLHVADQRLEKKLQQMIKIMTSGIQNVYSEPETSRWGNLRTVLESLHHLYFMVKSWTSCQETAAASNIKRLQELLILSTPSALFALILELVKTRTEKSVSNSQLGSSLISSNGRNSFNQVSGASSDSFDLDFDDPDAGSSVTAQDDFQQFEEDESKELSEGKTDEYIIVEDVNSFCLQDQCFILAIQWLTLANEFSLTTDKAEENNSYLFEAINLLLELSKYPSLEMVDIAVILKFIHTLFCAKYDEENIKDGFEIVSHLCRKHCSDPQVASYVVKIMADLIHVNGSCLSGTIRSIIMKLAKAFAQKQLEGNYGQSVSKAIILLNCELSKVDPERVWSKYGLADNDRCGEIYDHLCSSSIELRILAASFIHFLLVRSDGTPMDMHHQDKVFQEVYQTTLEALTVQGSLPEDFKSDEDRNRMVSFLLTLGVIAHNSPYLEAKALFALCLAVPECGVDSSLVSRLVGKVAVSRGCSLKSLMNQHLPYLATQWVQDNHDITAFPACLLEFTTQETFLDENKNILLPVLYECDKGSAVDLLAQSCGQEVSELLLGNFPTLMAHIFPYVAAEPNELMVSQLQNTRVQAAKRHYKLLERSFGSDVFSRLIDKHIGDIMLSLVKLVHDPDAMIEEEVIVEPNPPHFPSAVIQNTLKFLGRMFGEEISLVAVLAARRLELHKVFQGILEFLAKSSTPHTARCALSSVAVVIHSVLPHLEKLKDVSTYIIRSLIHILTCYTSSLQEVAPYLADHCNELLLQVCNAALENCHDSLISVIPSLFARVLPQTKMLSAVKESALSVIRLILTTSHPDVQLAAAGLPPFPDDEEYQSLNTLRELHVQLVASCRGDLALRDEVENFLSLPLAQMESHSVSHMLKLLQLQRVQTAELYKNVGVDQESIGHQLTYHLVSLAAGGDEKVSLQASKCLGELGPVSLGSPIFYIQDRNNSQFLHLGLSDTDIACKIITILNRYLTCEDIHVVQASSSALQKVLSTRDGYHAYHELEHTTQQELILLLPKSKPKAKSTSCSGVDAVEYEHLVGGSDIWFSESCYEVWVTRLACKLIEAGCGNEVITQVLPVCKVKPEFSTFMLPFIIHSALRTDSTKRRDILSRRFSEFFQRHVEADKLGSDTRGNGMDTCINKAALQVLLNIIDYLRAQTPSISFSNRDGVTPWERNLWLQVNYLQVAHAAHFCGAHFSALLFLHLHCETLQYTISRDPSGKNIVMNGLVSPLMQISNLPEAGSLSKLLLQVYSCLGDSDGVEGCVGSSKLDSSARAMRYHHRGQWMEAFAIHDAVNSSFGMVEGLRELGFFNALNTFLNERSPSLSQEVSEAQWESAWRLSQWDSVNLDEKWIEEGPLVVNGGVNFHQHLFCALQSLHHQDLGSLYQHTLRARQEVIKQLKLSRAESSSSIYPILSRLQILSEVEAASECLNDISCPTKFNTRIQNLEYLWTSEKTLAGIEHKYKEPILAARISTLQSLAGFHKEVHVDRILHTTLLTKSLLSRQCQKLGNTLGCETALICASKLNVPQNLVRVTHLEEAHVAKCRGEIQHAAQVLNSLLEELDEVNIENQEEKLLCQVLNLYGCVLMDARARSPQSIISDYFNKAVSILENSNDVESSKVLENSYHQLATYGDKLYREVHQYLESDTIQAKRETIRRSREESIHVKSLLERSKDSKERKELSRTITILEKNVGIDCSVLSDLEKEQQDYIYLALKNYLKCLLVSSEHDLHIYRVVGLWLENLTEEKINKLVLECGNKMKSYQFVPLLYQLSARLSCQRYQHQAFPSVLLHLLERVCLEHPHHSLPVIIALAHAHADDDVMKAGSKSRKQGSAVIEEDRVQAAKMLVNRLKKTAIADHVSEFEKVSLAYLTLANWCGSMNIKYAAGEKVKIPSNQPLVSLSNLRYTAALTCPIQLQPSALYSPSLIIGWDNMCTFVGGINAPKRLTLRTSDGLKQFELLKGRDDIRQDAVMEQVFGIVNELLTKSSETRERALSMRTYQVVPLSQKSGLIQWCNNTQAFGEYLIGPDKKSGAHKLYYPEDYTANACRNKMMFAKSLPLEDQCRLFQDILEHFHPVFRHFFLENYPSPHEWYKRQLAYTKSVATNSMVGYILGLGDRHVENILLDKSTAELIHIDLGIAFELGKILPTPETIPFRMTQDIVDGLGVMGVEGPLRRCCEATLNVLRSSGEVLVTVVEVLRHDPLHQWTLSPRQVAHLQASGDDEMQGIGCVNSASMADRVVLRVQQKLAGVEDGYPRTVTEQVTVLIQQATDHSNLSRLFPGWQPYV